MLNFLCTIMHMHTLPLTHIHSFLFKGDGRAVAIPTQQAPIYDVPRSSFDTSLPPSYKRHNSIPNYNNHALVRSRSHNHDSGYPPSSIGSMNTPPQLDGPPVWLDKHPSIRRKSGGTHPRDLSRSNSTNSFGSLSDRDMSYPPTARSGDMVEPPHGGDGSDVSSRSNSPPDDNGDVIGQMDQPTNGHYDSVPKQVSPDGGIATMQRRLVLGGVVDETPSHYEEMTHPRNSMQDFDGYVSMKPAEKVIRATSASIPISKRNTVPPADDTYHHLQRSPSPQNSSSPRGRNNYDQLPTISERSNYENHPLPQDLKGKSIEYRPNYQNVELAERGRRGSLNQEVYEHVDSRGEQSQNSNGNNSNGGGQKRKFSLRRRSSDKECVKLNVERSNSNTNRREGLTQNNGFGDAEAYVVIQSKSVDWYNRAAPTTGAGPQVTDGVK